MDRYLQWFIEDRIPTVKVLIVSNALTYFVGIFANLRSIEHLWTFEPSSLALQPWTILTYPLWTSSRDVISVLFACYWLWVAGGSLERAWGSTKFATYFFSMSAISALGLFPAWIISGTNVGASGLWLPLAGATIAFAMRDPERQILFFFLIPLKLKYLALLDVVILLVSYGRISPVCGLLGLTGCVYSYAYVRARWSYKRVYYQPDDKIVRIHKRKNVLRWINPLNWYREYRIRKSLRDLFDK
ncbi:MAG: rhomboid family intramembrane serine protease [Armatimonadota bacterium]